MSNWITQEEVALQLQKKDMSLLDERGITYCVSDDFQYCVFIRCHQAWYIENEGWRDANIPPDAGEMGRQMLIFLKLNSFWFKMFIPLTIEIKALTATTNQYTIEASTGQITGRFSSLPQLFVHTMNGNAEKEAEIKDGFDKIALL